MYVRGKVREHVLYNVDVYAVYTPCLRKKAVQTYLLLLVCQI